MKKYELNIKNSITGKEISAVQYEDLDEALKASKVALEKINSGEWKDYECTLLEVKETKTVIAHIRDYKIIKM